MKAFSAFSGIRGFEQGFYQAGVRIEWIGYSEIDKYACQIFSKHFSQKNYGDITKITTDKLPDFDLLVGGFPCQSFSIAGKRGGFEDTRGTLFFELARILKDKKPRNFIFENVKGLLSHDSGRTFAKVIQALDELGYFVEWQVLNSKNYGVPQDRGRVFIIGHFGGIPRRKVFPVTENDRKINGVQGQCTNTITARYEGAQATGSYIIEGQQYEKEKLQSQRIRSIIRRLTPLECERLQGFPDGWTEGISDTQRYKCLGNAVTTNVIEFLARSLF